MKGPAGYIGASRLHYACYYLQKAHIENEIEAMVEFYPLIVECAIELRYQVRKLIWKYDGRGNAMWFTNICIEGHQDLPENLW